MKQCSCYANFYCPSSISSIFNLIPKRLALEVEKFEVEVSIVEHAILKHSKDKVTINFNVL